VELTAGDREIFDEFFPGGGEMTLVMQPTRQAVTHVGLFPRGRDGRVAALPEAQLTLEFPLPSGRPLRRAPAEGEPEPRPERPRAAPSAAPANAPSFASGQNPVAWWKWATISVALAGAGVLSFLLTQPRTAPDNAPPLALQLEDQNGQLRVEWARNAVAVRSAEQAQLIIVDGQPLPPFRLDEESIRTGSVTYARRTEDVSVRLVVERQGRTVEAAARFVGPPIAKVPPEGLAEAETERDRLLGETGRLREDLKKEEARTRTLQRTVNQLASRNGQAAARKK
jgi:hypothetical protein